MNPACLQHCLTEAERVHFEEQGYLAVPGALPSDLVVHLVDAVDRLHAQDQEERGLDPTISHNHFDFIGRNAVFLKPLDWPATFPKVWGILGWHIQLYHTHFTVTPPLAEEARDQPKRLGWHQDSGRLNLELEGNPRPRVSVKVAFFLTDCSMADRGNFHVIPGSHLHNELGMPADGISDPEGATPIITAPGDAVIFDRRIWHSGGRNISEVTRKVLFYGYSYRWLKPRDDMTVDHVIGNCDPIRQQLLGSGPSGGHGFSSPKEEDVPLKTWIAEHLGEEAVVP
ncbi:MAG: phytanoyl-CoA dioxygenase family protein [Candidatus Latescibacterota bacterium]|nr:phytanoyl-CoA dioxygenase family protein [Candidatus Latescibacterota bacterium]